MRYRRDRMENIEKWRIEKETGEIRKRSDSERNKKRNKRDQKLLPIS